jgi:hypothetical protein
MTRFIANEAELLNEPAGWLVLDCVRSTSEAGERTWRFDSGSVYGNRLSTLFSSYQPHGHGRDKLMVVAVESPIQSWTVSYHLFC